MRNELIITADYYYVVYATATGIACIFNILRVFHIYDNKHGYCHLSFRRILMAIYFSKNLIITKRCIREKYLVSYKRDTRHLLSNNALRVRSTCPETSFFHRTMDGEDATLAIADSSCHRQ